MILLMAWRNIWRNKMRSITIMLSVAIGLLAGVVVLSIYEGMLTGRVRIAIDTEISHIQIHHDLFKQDQEAMYVINDIDTIAASLCKMPEIKAVAVRSVSQGMLTTTTGSSGMQVNGVNTRDETIVSGLQKKIKEGKTLGDKKNEILIGKKLADKMKLKPGGKLVMTLTDKDNNIISASFRISGIYESGNAPLDEFVVYVNRASLNTLLNIDNAGHEIAILLKEDNTLDKVLAQLKSQYPAYKVESWKDVSPETELMVDTMDQYSYIVIAIIMLALSFGIINTMLMAILERTREIGMMMALGMSKIRLFLLVFLETIFLSIIGSPIGIFIAWLLISVYNKKGIDITNFAGEVMKSFGYGAIIYPEFPWAKISRVMLVVFITAIISCILPALKALRLRPVVALNK